MLSRLFTLETAGFFFIVGTDGYRLNSPGIIEIFIASLTQPRAAQKLIYVRNYKLNCFRKVHKV